MIVVYSTVYYQYKFTSSFHLLRDETLDIPISINWELLKHVVRCMAVFVYARSCIQLWHSHTYFLHRLDVLVNIRKNILARRNSVSFVANRHQICLIWLRCLHSVLNSQWHFKNFKTIRITEILNGTSGSEDSILKRFLINLRIYKLHYNKESSSW